MDDYPVLTKIFVSVVGGLILTFLVWLIRRIRQSILAKTKRLTVQHSVFLSRTLNIIKDKCLGRHDTLKEVYEYIKGEEPCNFINNHIYISGEEGIGKTLFLLTLFYDYFISAEIYLGWIECNGEESIFEIISKNFIDSRFHYKRKKRIIGAITNLERPCIIFIDQICNKTKISEIEELSKVANLTLVLSGELKQIRFINKNVKLLPLDECYIYEIFEIKGNVYLDFLEFRERSYVKSIIKNYVKGNPFLATAFACADVHYNNSWERVSRHISKLQYYSDKDYIKTIIRQLYKIDLLSDFERNALSKIAALGHQKYTYAAFEWLEISANCVKDLCGTYWLSQEDSILYSMDSTHMIVLNKVLKYNTNLKQVLIAITHSLISNDFHKDYGFRWFAIYIEDVLKVIKGFEKDLMNDEVFSTFTWVVATKYSLALKNYNEAYEWLQMCKPVDISLKFQTEIMRFTLMTNLYKTRFSLEEVENAYNSASDTLKKLDEELAEHQQFFLNYEYIRFLIYDEQYERVIALCKEHFKIFGYDLNSENSCSMFYHYITAAYYLEDDKKLRELCSSKFTDCLFQNENDIIEAIWCMYVLYKIYIRWGNIELGNRYLRQYIMQSNKKIGFLNPELKKNLHATDEEFSLYMHSHEDLIKSLSDAVMREDPEALYLEGRFQEKLKNYDLAYGLYEKAARKDSLRGLCSLAMMCYKGLSVDKNYEFAYRYWNYCINRGHRGAFYWMGIMMLDKNYTGYNPQKASEYLTEAAYKGSARAKDKLNEISKSYLKFPK